MFEETIAQHGTKFLVAALAVLLGLACLALVLWIVRRRPSSPFIRGGRNRQPRLSVLDAAAVDTRRRLVLVRRDDVEHLLMIGGPTDIVIESRILAPTQADAPETATSGTIAAPMPSEPMPAEPAIAAIIPAQEPAPATVAARPAPAAVAVPSAPAVVRTTATVLPTRAEQPAPPMPASGISAMGNMLYGADTGPAVATPRASQPLPEAAPARAAPPAPSLQPVHAPAPSLERNAIDALDRARDRVLTSPVGTGSERLAPQAMPTPSPAQPQTPAVEPQRPAVENAALVSEFERILEQEIATAPARSTGSVAPGTRTEPAAPEAGPQQPKSREETEAEMARLLGEISVTRNS
ncbi:flagellar biosynthetic protein FliO [Mycoplana rhizolycopersici]|uniref:Flagellar biosynthetic protein FliO n=1 Tax=Mycoplana rhizolycopersici TaxID=2746702 RepID=A0ABX2QL52_9HYPH|nr:flagellar biosynthetic protein FliO [Rhizobium rhizolycopersici]NVP57061.1 flagellar biosynthetic protein FliO [Rhizobium rhizolycopersici]